MNVEMWAFCSFIWTLKPVTTSNLLNATPEGFNVSGKNVSDLNLLSCPSSAMTNDELGLRESAFSSESLKNNSSLLECGPLYKQVILKNNEFKLTINGLLFNNIHGRSYDSSLYCLRYTSESPSSRETTGRWRDIVCQPLTFEINWCCSTLKPEDYEDKNIKGKSDCYSNINLSSPIQKNIYFNETSLIYMPIYKLKCVLSHQQERTLKKNSIIFTRSSKTLAVIHNNDITDSYCIKKGDNDDLYPFLYCPVKEAHDEIKMACEKEICVRKCCPNYELYDLTKRKCTPVGSEDEWPPKIDQETSNNFSTNFKYKSIYGFPPCTSYFHLQPNKKPEDKFFLLENGTLFVEKYKQSYDHNFFCTDFFKKGDTITQDALLCFPKQVKNESRKCDRIRTTIKSILMAVSCIFLALTVVVYGSLPDFRSKINGKCVISSTVSLLMAYICLITTNWTSGKITMTTCEILGILTQFFSLASFFWLNVMCYDVWTALRSHRQVALISKQSANRRHWKYSLYAWGIPLVLSAITACMQFLQEDGEGILVPGFGRTGCFFPTNDVRPSWAYFYGFVTLQMAANVVFFVHLFFMLLREKTRNDSALHRTNKRHVMWAKLYLKLFCVMGVTWIFEIISWAEGSCKTWIWADALNALRGLFIFAIFVLKKNVIRKVQSAVLHREANGVTSSKTGSQNSSSSSKRSHFCVESNVAETTI